ncbi:DegT/DnrJ/EryC1/StrS family aminotransferase [Crocinitomicaceae bacterium CZZ-1]|uniref:DegT/DnrJ/EryC1/StrS family aminotransferase n=1 Tax=Taishania pollutisoli TaxID=2766479 RepID=A0A8J6PLF9_9FLAO|nr:DegT/DnrJ/EryC1/StrS family aminotransferase [Taishania pollutisoli]MBC9813829.1 DegT/DnrJ/EryC1/StrS family aminotransferase [Taishania pollutisoli]MBX2950820.1 DegT/DnrJ/EryC1/StrS family aminotransferase [Crocinitomicaceae bacterium]NGF77342.1 DegT/DnrJ/EryC1/StrS family aminotransferase [Fluviicola sp. SGL-29]
MKKIQMVDLMTQYQSIKQEVDTAILNVIENAQFINGPEVSAFQKELEEYLNAKHVIPCANGTDALQIALMALGLKPGDEVITPSFTYVATTEVIALLGLKPVFVEVDKATFCIDVTKIEAAITPKTKAIVPVHLYGQAAEMDVIMDIARKHNLFVVEDNAQAIGCNYTHADGRVSKTGTIGTIGCTSFFPSKNLGCYGDGGALYTNNDELAAQIRMIANHGQSKRYYHDVVGCNSRLDSIQAAVLRIKLRRLDEYNAKRRAVADYYDRFFAKYDGIQTPVRDPKSAHVFHQYTLIVEGMDRDALNAYLAEKDIPSMIYYPVPAHKQKMFAAFNSETTNLPITDWLTERVISLPIHTEMEEEQLKTICNAVASFIEKQ